MAYPARQGIVFRNVLRVQKEEKSSLKCDSINDEIALEAPLQIRLAGDRFISTMRTPGADEDLVLGLLWSEGIIQNVDDVAAIAHCDPHTVDVRPGPGAVLEPTSYAMLSSTSCGLCGREHIEDLIDSLHVDPPQTPLPLANLFCCVQQLHHGQPIFGRTGADARSGGL